MEPEMRREGRADDGRRDAGRGWRVGAAYGTLYATFTLALVFAPEAMNQTALVIGERELSFGGLNLALVSGIGMMIAAILLTLAQVRVTSPPDGGQAN
jgi:hypothetical protein